MAAYAGTVEPGVALTTRSNEPPDFGIGVYVGGDKVATVALVGEAGDSKERLADELPRLYRT